VPTRHFTGFKVKISIRASDNAPLQTSARRLHPLKPRKSCWIHSTRQICQCSSEGRGAVDNLLDAKMDYNDLVINTLHCKWWLLWSLCRSTKRSYTLNDFLCLSSFQRRCLHQRDTTSWNVGLFYSCHLYTLVPCDNWELSSQTLP
jgi:hypothetical protein